MRSHLSLRRLLALLISGCSLTAAAQEKRDFAVERFSLASDRSGLLETEWGAPPAQGTFSVYLWTGWERDPLVLYRLSDGKELGPLIHDRVGGELGGSYSFLDWLEFGVALPYVLSQARPSDQPDVSVTPLGSLDRFGVGDIKLRGKIGLLRQAKHGIDLAFAPELTLPLAGQSQYRGEPTVTFNYKLAASRELQSRIRLAANLGVDIRGRTQLLNQQVRSEINYSAAAGYRFLSLPLEVAASIWGAVPLQAPFKNANETSVETRGSAGVQVLPWLNVFAAAGAGLFRGWGTPEWRVLGGLQFGPTTPVEDKDKDTDGDGIPDRFDRCPNEPGPWEYGGCPCPKTDLPAQCKPPEPPPPAPQPVVVVPVAPPPEPTPVPVVPLAPPPEPPKLEKAPELPALPPEPPKAKLEKGRISIVENVRFETAKDVIRPESFELLDNVAKVLADNPQVTLVRVEGHTDSQGKKDFNQDLSERRSRAVRNYLIQKGVEPARLEAHGFGQSRPIDSNDTRAGRARNRRVEFVVVDGSDGVKNKETP